MNYKNIRWERVAGVAMLIIAIASTAIWGIVVGTEKVEPTPSTVTEISEPSSYEKKQDAISKCVSNLTYETTMRPAVAYQACKDIYESATE